MLEPAIKVLMDRGRVVVRPVGHLDRDSIAALLDLLDSAREAGVIAAVDLDGDRAGRSRWQRRAGPRLRADTSLGSSDRILRTARTRTTLVGDGSRLPRVPRRRCGHADRCAATVRASEIRARRSVLTAIGILSKATVRARQMTSLCCMASENGRPRATRAVDGRQVHAQEGAGRLSLSVDLPLVDQRGAARWARADGAVSR